MGGSDGVPLFARALARLGVVVFAIVLLVPTIAFDRPRERSDVLVAAASDARAEHALPNQVARLSRRVVVVPPAASADDPAQAPEGIADDRSGVIVTASWYGPGFYENRLPCWQWLQASGLPIQLLPDTWGVAHRTLPCGTMLTITHGANTITVPVVDRGPYVPGRELDLSPLAKAALGCTDLCTVVMQIE